MSDEKLRELERRFRETGSAEDEVAWLRTRARSGENLDWERYSRLHELDVDAAADYLRWRVATGDLTQERLELAAYCGHSAAQAAVGLVSLDFPGLARQCAASELRAYLVAGLAIGALYASHSGHSPPLQCPCGSRDCPSEVLSSAARWVIAPSDENRRLAMARGLPDWTSEAVDLPLFALSEPKSPRVLAAYLERAGACLERKVGKEQVNETVRAVLVFWALDSTDGVWSAWPFEPVHSGS